MGAIDQAVAHFRTLETESFEVPEWDLTVYVKPLSLKNLDDLQRKTAKSSDIDTAIQSLIMFASDGDGEPLFDPEDKPKLKAAADPSVVLRVGGQIMEAVKLGDEGAEAKEDAEKN